MPISRKRAGHPHQKTADVPASQRTTGHFIWALLFGIFGLLIALFASGSNYLSLLLGAAIGAVIGWVLGRKMERDSKA